MMSKGWGQQSGSFPTRVARRARRRYLLQNTATKPHSTPSRNVRRPPGRLPPIAVGSQNESKNPMIHLSVRGACSAPGCPGHHAVSAHRGGSFPLARSLPTEFSMTLCTALPLLHSRSNFRSNPPIPQPPRPFRITPAPPRVVPTQSLPRTPIQGRNPDEQAPGSP